MQKQSLLADLIDIRQQVEIDRSLSRDHLNQRDRQIGLSAPDKLGSTDSKKLRYWINSLRQQKAPSAKQDKGDSIDRSLRGLIAILWLFGLVSGVLLGRAVLHYDGSAPVNIISTLLLLVGLQLVTLVLLVLLSAGGFSRVLDGIGVVNPGRLVASLLTRLSPNWRDQFQRMTGESVGITGFPIERKLAVYLSQHFTVALNVGIIATLLFLVMVSDLAFGWNTTLKIDNSQVTRWFQVISIPWQSWLPEAVPTMELIESSRYYRLQGQLQGDGWAAAKLGTWWVFLLLTVVIYGLLPRIASLVLTGIDYDRVLIRAMGATPGAGQIIARMQSPLVTTVATDTPESDGVTASTVPFKRRQSATTMTALVVEWSGARINTRGLERAGFEPQHVFTAGGHQSLAEDRAISSHIAEHHPQGVVIAVRAWEPPMLDFSDFLQGLRTQLDANCPIIVSLSPVDANTSVTAEQLLAWETALNTLADSALYVEVL